MIHENIIKSSKIWQKKIRRQVYGNKNENNLRQERKRKEKKETKNRKQK